MTRLVKAFDAACLYRARHRRFLTPRELAIVSRINTRLLHCTRRHLYRAIIKSGGAKIRATAAQKLFLTLVRCPDLARLVKVFDAAAVTMPVQSKTLYRTAFRLMVNLEVFSVASPLDDAALEGLQFSHLRMLKVANPAPQQFIQRHSNLEALHIGFHTDGEPLDIGPGDRLHFLRCNYEEATQILRNAAPRQLAEDALLDIEASESRAAHRSTRALLEAFATSTDLPEMVELSRFSLKQLALHIRDTWQAEPVGQNCVMKLRIQIDVTEPREAENSSPLKMYLRFAQHILRAFSSVHVLEIRDNVLLEKHEGESWLTDVLCNELRRIAQHLSTVVGPSGKTLSYDTIRNKWVAGIEPDRRVNPFHAEFETPLWT